MGTAESPGTIVTTVVGDVVAPDVGEVEMGTPLRAVIDAVGSGLVAGRSVKAVFSGVANAVVTAARSRRAGELRGLPGDRQRHGLGRVHRLRRHDLHGRRGVPLLAVPVDRVVRPVPAVQAGLERDHRTPRTHRDRRRHTTATSTRSPAGWATSPMAAAAYLAIGGTDRGDEHPAAFPEEFTEHIELGRCPRPRRLPIPKLIDLADGRAVYDESFWRKRPDWTYAPDRGR